jgi:hypothetical protein
VANPFYSSEQTEQSKVVLGELLAAVPGAILIGGWATWARVGGAMSHDIDLIVTRAELAQITRLADEISQSRHLAGTKWRGTWRGIHIDLYVPHQSLLGANLQLRVEALVRHAESVEGRRLLSVPAHIATKLAALLDRPDSLPGRKDRHELQQLLGLPGASGAPEVIKAASLRTPAELAELVDHAFMVLAGDSSLARQDRARLRQMSQQWHHRVAPGPTSGSPASDRTRGIDLRP